MKHVKNHRKEAPRVACVSLDRIKMLYKELDSQRGVGRNGRRGKASETQREGPGRGAAGDGLYLP